MANITFGKKSFNQPTPSSLANKIDLYCVLAGVICTWLGTSAANFIPVLVSVPMQSLLSLSIALALASKPFFGVKTNKKNIPVEDVSAMDEPKTN